MTSLVDSELGKKSAYINQYNPNLLFPIPRAIKRNEIGIDNSNPGFIGEDIWTHYEVSWLNNKGKPCVAIGEITYPATSPNIIESKSMKLYFNSFNGTRFATQQDLQSTIIKDLSTATQSTVKVKLLSLDEINPLQITPINQYYCIDNLDIECDIYQPNRNYLNIENPHLVVNEKLYSNLLKSNCLITQQPDWGTIFIEYTGHKISHAGILKYIVSLRDHNEFHEQCVERIFYDIKTLCNPSELTIYARYTRRGGIDINPFRTTKQNYQQLNHRLVRQ